MKKLFICLALGCTGFILPACGNNVNTSTSTLTSTSTSQTEQAGKSVEKVKSGMEAAGYTVTSQTIGGVSASIAVKGSDTLTVLFFPTIDAATQAKPTYDATASASSYTCKRDGKNLYYGSSAAIAAYEAIA